MRRTPPHELTAIALPGVVAARCGVVGRLLLALGVRRVARPTVGEVTYTTSPYDRRALTRRRTRLKPGKLADPQNRFIVDCMAHDRSPGGLRLTLLGAAALPDRVRFFDDSAGQLWDATVTWRKGTDVGITLDAEVHTGAAGRMPGASLGKTYYALR